MKILSRYGKWFVIFLAILMVAPTARGERLKAAIKFADQQYDSLSLNNAIAQFIIEHGYGHKTELKVVGSADMMKMLPSGDLDVVMEGWEHNKLEWYNEQLNKGTIENLGPTFESGPQFFIIPKWMADEYNIKTVADMKEHWQLVKDPKDPSRGLFHNCPSGSSSGKVNAVKLEAYGLYKFYNPRPVKSYGAMETALADAQKKHLPIFSYYWEPSVIMGMYDWHILEEPPYSDKVWGKIKDASEYKIRRPIDSACAYPSIPINKLANSDLRMRAPEVAAMLRKMHVGLERLTMLMVWARENNVNDWDKVTLHFLREYYDEWGKWMPDEPYIKTWKAVQEAFDF